MIRLPALLLSLAAAAPVQAEIALRAPVDCDLGAVCYIQNYVDRDPGPGFHDFTCGPLGYDGHSGTDFALPDLTLMARGVAVVAPAPGTVRGVRDGMPDIARDSPDAPPLEGRDCGNGVLIDHGGGWTSQLCHLRQGSVRVRPGDRLVSGQQVGLVGLSGNTEFPHVHMTLRKDDVVVDPFHPAAMTADACTETPRDSLWTPPLAYVPGGVTMTGISPAPPEFAEVLAGMPTPDPMAADAAALVVWAVFFGTRQGDRIELRLRGPGGMVAEQVVTVERTQARAFRFTGRRLTQPRWPAGRYGAEVALRRNGMVIDTGAAFTTIP